MTVSLTRRASLDAGAVPLLDRAFHSVALAQPGHAAIRERGVETTYRALDERAAAIAHLVAQAFRSERPDPPHVGLLLDQGADAIAAILGVLRAGLAYVPLDPADPAVRLQDICADTQMGALVTTARHAALAASLVPDGVPILRADSDPADRDAAEGASELGLAEDRAPSADDPAVVIYTSGSTGRPKGVIQTHRTLDHYARSYARLRAMGPDDRVSMLYTLSFSAASVDIYGSLLHGATICTYDIRRRGMDGLAAWLREECITVLHCVPTVFRHLAEHLPGAGAYDSVRAIALGGESVFRSDIRLARSAFPPGCVVVNHYAAAEVSLMAQHIADEADLVGDGVVPVGSAGPGMEVLLEGTDGSAVEPGDAGDIVIRSRYLSPGYWQRDETTARSFSADPQDPTLRRYRTGDSGMLDDRGRVVVLGRSDARVKIRGNSVDPAEVEAAIRGLPGVLDAVVDAERDAADALGDPRLVGYVVADGPLSDAVTLRRALADRLPRYMLPAEVRVLASFPLTATGKVDRAALPDVLRLDTPGPVAAAVADEGGSLPRGELEVRVAAIFAEVLRVPVSSRFDDFFMLGGTSLTLTQLQSVLRRELGADADPSEIVNGATVSQVAASVAARQGPRPVSPLLVPLRETGSAAPVFLVHGALGLAFVSPQFIQAIGPEHPVYSFQAKGMADDAEPHATIDAMADDYVTAMREVHPSGAPVLVGICAGGIVAQSMACKLRADGDSLRTLIMIDPPFPPHARPLATRMRELAVFWLGIHRARWLPGGIVGARMDRRIARRIARHRPVAVRPIVIDPANASRVALSIRIALRRHRPEVYDGPVHVLASERRLHARGWRTGVWRALLTGSIELTEIGTHHRDVLSPGNERFRAAIRRAMDAAAQTTETAAKRSAGGPS